MNRFRRTLVVTFILLLLPTVVCAQRESAKVQEMRRKAEAGDAVAQYNLGVMYLKGDGVPKDAVQAVSWSRKAAEQGHAGAKYNLGVMYAKGEGVPKDLVLAYMWVNLAAAQGKEKYKNSRDLLEKAMTSAQIDEAQRLSREWKPKK